MRPANTFSNIQLSNSRVTSLYGASDLYNTYVGGADALFLVMLVLMLVMLAVYVVLVRKCNQKYFGIK